jgi:hypothetical protein
LLLSGARRDSVPAALLLPGAGLEGGGALPDWRREFPRLDAGARQPGTCDPMVGALEWDVRPVNYAEAFARVARRLLLAEEGHPRPPWWEAAHRSAAAQVVDTDLPVALARLHAAVVTEPS